MLNQQIETMTKGLRMRRIACVVAFALSIGSLVLGYRLLPEHMAIHFGLDGTADGWSF